MNLRSIFLIGVFFACPAALVSAETSDSAWGLLNELAAPLLHADRPHAHGVKALSAVRPVDPKLWTSLLDRVVQRPNLPVEHVTVRGTEYQIFIVATETAVAGQKCPAGSQLQNAVFVSKVDKGIGEDVYPVRIRSMCSDSKGILGLVSVRFDWDGNSMNQAVTDSRDPNIHPWCDTVDEKDIDSHDFSSCTDRLIQLFLNLP